MSRKIWGRIAAVFTAGVLLATGIGADRAYAANSQRVKNDADTKRTATLVNYKINIPEAQSTNRNPLNYAASVANVVTLVDNNNNINVAFFYDKKVYVQRYDADMKEQTMIWLDSSFADPLFGDVACDSEGNYYVVWGQNDTKGDNIYTISVAKYDNGGNLISEAVARGKDATAVYTGGNFGTRKPFYNGSCDIAINGNVIAVNLAREMYVENQSSVVLYVNKSTMKYMWGDTAWTTHAYDQRVYGVSDGGFVSINQGDSSNRGFHIVKEGGVADSNASYNSGKFASIYTFHFREGMDQEDGYNYTFAQLGGLAEIDSSYVFAASSERALSLAPKAANAANSARDVFVQFIKKDFTTKGGKDNYTVAGETRSIQGTKPTTAKTKLFLDKGDSDYGVVWLTAYDDKYYAANPKVVSLGSDRFAVMWEKRAYAANDISTYMAVLDGKGNVVIDTCLIQNSLLAADTDPVVVKGKIYWTTKDGNGAVIHCLTPNGYSNAANDVGLTLDKASTTVRVGESITIKATTKLSDKVTNVTWESTKPEIATVDASGKVTGVAVGETEIIARSWVGDVTAKCVVKVLPIGVAGITLDKTEMSMSAGDIAKLTAKITPSDAGNQKVFWFSLDPRVLSVDENGNVTALSAGEGTIVANTEDGWYEAKCRITVSGEGSVDLSEQMSQTKIMHRLYNPNSGEHFYTASESEKNHLVKAGWKFEGTAWTAPKLSYTPVYRMYNPNAGDHHYTTKKKEVDSLAKSGWKYEGIAWYSDDNKTVPLYRLYNPNAVSGSHHYTTKQRERDALISVGWKEEGIGWYGL